MSRRINVHLKGTGATSYPIHIGDNHLVHPEHWLPTFHGSVIILTDHRVQQLYAEKLKTALNKAGFESLLLSIPPGEKSKNIRNKCKLEESMLRSGCTRETLILALGGGVVGDLAGFIAATYMRGVPFLQIPTTLLSMLDSSVGGKTGINNAYGKNLIGAFWQPVAVASDVSLLKTLPKRQLINGLIEAIKIFITCDKEGLVFVENQLDNILKTRENTLIELVSRAVQIKADVVAKDEKENHQRMILNFGHTIGHALEHLSQYQLLHGYAVGIGMLLEAKIAETLGILDKVHFQQIQQLLQRVKITPQNLTAFPIDAILQSTQLDKKKRNGKVNYVLINQIGDVYQSNQQFAHPITDEVVKNAYQMLKDSK